MLNHTWKSHLAGAGINAAIYTGLATLFLLVFFFFATLAGEIPIWQKIIWYTVFPLAGLPWPESISSIFACFLSNAIAWGCLVQLIIMLRSLKRAQPIRY